MIEQWRAVKAPDERFKLLLTQIDASVAAMKTASKVGGQQALLLKNKGCSSGADAAHRPFLLPPIGNGTTLCNVVTFA